MKHIIKNIAVIGCSGAIGASFTERMSSAYPDATLHAFSRQEPKHSFPNVVYHTLDYSDEKSIEAAAHMVAQDNALDWVIVATGLLHDHQIKPEKSLRDISAENFNRIFAANTLFPALVAKHFLPKMNKETRSVFAALSARVGSISDNRLGGWYAYRASKSALNMIIKTAAIETNRNNKHAIIVGIHPGTVDSELSRPFQSQVKANKLFTADFAVEKMLGVLDNLSPHDSGKCFAWDGEEIIP